MSTKQTIYVRRDVWHTLRRVAVDEQCSASAIAVALVEHYIASKDPTFRTAITERAREITRGARGAVR